LRILKKKAALSLSIALILALTGCGPGGPPDDEEPPARPVAVNIIETAASVEAGRTFQFHYSVSNTTNTTCSWSVNDVAGGNAAVGTIGADGLYTAPAAVPNPAQVSVKAVASADTTKSDTAAVTITPPPPFTVLPATATVPAGGTQLFTTTADVTWSLAGAAGNTAPLGSIAPDGVYTAPLAPPLGGEVTIIATSKADTAVHATALASIQFSNASLHGPYAFVYRGADAAGLVFIGGRLTADGAGAITDGILDMSQGSGVLIAVPFTGTYLVAADGRAALDLTVGQDVIPLRLILLSDAAARMIGFADGRTGIGELERQEESAFGTGLLGTFVFTYDGLDHYTSDDPKRGQPIAAVGRFTVGGAALDPVHDGIADINRNGQWITSGDVGPPFFGVIGYNGTYGSGLIGLGGVQGVTSLGYYMLSADAALFSGWYSSIFLGERTGAIGKIVRPAAGPFSDAAFQGDMTTMSHGYGAVASPTPDPFVPAAPAFSAGIMAADGAGHFTGGLVDTNVGGTVGQALPAAGTYAIASNGRGTSTITAGGLTNHTAFYMLSNNTAYTVGLDTWGTGVSLLGPQGGTKPFGASSLNGHYAFTLRGTLTAPGTDAVGQIGFDGAGGLAGLVDVNAAGVRAADVTVTGSYTLAATGRGTATISTPTTTWTVTMYVRDDKTIDLVGTGAPSNGSLIRQY
jgi:hypothetical protein